MITFENILETNSQFFLVDNKENCVCEIYFRCEDELKTEMPCHYREAFSLEYGECYYDINEVKSQFHFYQDNEKIWMTLNKETSIQVFPTGKTPENDNYLPFNYHGQLLFLPVAKVSKECRQLIDDIYHATEEFIKKAKDKPGKNAFYTIIKDEFYSSQVWVDSYSSFMAKGTGTVFYLLKDAKEVLKIIQECEENPQNCHICQGDYILY